MQSKKVLVLAAGKGIRMLPLTNEKPKPLISINEKPFIYYVLNNIQKAGFIDIGIVVGYKKEMIKTWVSENYSHITFIDQEQMKGTADAVFSAKHWADDQDFIVIMADNLYSPMDIKNVACSHYPCIAGIEHEHPENFGILIGNKFLEKIVEKPKHFVGNLINTGLYKLPPAIFDIIPLLKKSERGEYEITDALTILAKNQSIEIYKIKDYWINLGSIHDIKKVEEFVRKNF